MKHLRKLTQNLCLFFALMLSVYALSGLAGISTVFAVNSAACTQCLSTNQCSFTPGASSAFPTYSCYVACSGTCLQNNPLPQAYTPMGASVNPNSKPVSTTTPPGPTTTIAPLPGFKNVKSYTGTGVFNIGACGDINDPDKNELKCVVQKALDLTILLVGPLVTVMIVISGVFYITSAGNPTRVEQAKKTLVGSIIGLIIVVLAYTIVRLLTELFK